MEAFNNISLSFKCPKQLNQLQACNGGYYCDGCQKVVHDFRGMTEAQVLKTIATSSQSTCGIFEAGKINLAPSQTGWLKWASAAMMFLGLTACHKNDIGLLKLQDTVKIQAANDKTPDENISVGMLAVNIEPQFRGGADSLYRYIASRLNNKKGVSGLAITTFIIERDGSITDVKTIKSVDPAVDDQIIKVIQNMPKWIPGIQNGKATKVQYTIPIRFSNE